MAEDHASVVGVNAAQNLLGVELPGGWKVVDRLDRRSGESGGNFSVNYWVEHESGRRGFCKVLNFDWLVRLSPLNTDPVKAIAEATAIYQFERDMARRCIALSRVITAIDDGSINLPGYAQPLVAYIIFESAEQDIRRLLNAADSIDVAVRLRCLHHLSSGLRQLHSIDVAHQDVKPSNTLVFASDESGVRETKVGDLGRASARGQAMYFDAEDIAGDPNYAPIEGLYRSIPAEFAERRLACDLYQLGGMICYAFTGVTFNAVLFSELHPHHHPANWTGTYEAVLPYVRDAFGRALENMAISIPSEIRDRTTALVAQLCDPDVKLRGHRVTRVRPGNPYDLHRIVTELDFLSRRAEAMSQ
jgi:serine/threonine protein kinase